MFSADTCSKLIVYDHFTQGLLETLSTLTYLGLKGFVVVVGFSILASTSDLST
ncbi:hypothetical protein ACJX0J_008341, partial [Zea mays]